MTASAMTTARVVTTIRGSDRFAYSLRRKKEPHPEEYLWQVNDYDA